MLDFTNQNVNAFLAVKEYFFVHKIRRFRVFCYAIRLAKQKESWYNMNYKS